MSIYFLVIIQFYFSGFTGFPQFGYVAGCDAAKQVVRPV